MYFTYILLTVELFSLVNFVSCIGYLRDDESAADAAPAEDEAPAGGEAPAADEAPAAPDAAPGDPDHAANATTKDSFEEDEDNENNEPIDYFSYVALIDIVFQDGSKRTCTGAIVRENTVLTAAHCFTLGYQKNVQVELTASFVVIGTRLMFESGYEHYLPIEKILTHPNYTGWTADLALVFTYSGMISDKPGKVVPLAGENDLTPVDSNVTVLSWGKCRETNTDNVKESNEENKDEMSMKKKTNMPEFKEEMGSQTEDRKVARSGEVNTMAESSDSSDEDKQTNRVSHLRKIKQKSVYTKRNGEVPVKEPQNQIQNRFNVQSRPGGQLPSGDDTTASAVELTGSSKRTVPTQKNRSKKNIKTKLRSRPTTASQDDVSDVLKERVDGKSIKNPIRLRAEKGGKNQMKWPESVTLGWLRRKRSHFHSHNNWRRHMPPLKNNLTVETFNFVNSLACIKLVEKSMPSFFSIKNKNEIVCYTSDEHFITFEDSGSPVLQQGHLVAVTVGGTEWEGDHVAIGMKISCFCPWIAENIPNDTGPKIKCCTNCCTDTRTLRRNQKQHKPLRYMSNLEDYNSEPESPSLYRRADVK